MTHAELIAILEDQAHPGHAKLVQRVARFLAAGGIPAICFGIHVDQVPGAARAAKVAQVLQGLAEGEAKDKAFVLEFIRQTGHTFTNLLNLFESRAGTQD